MWKSENESIISSFMHKTSLQLTFHTQPSLSSDFRHNVKFSSLLCSFHSCAGERKSTNATQITQLEGRSLPICFLSCMPHVKILRDAPLDFGDILLFVRYREKESFLNLDFDISLVRLLWQWKYEWVQNVLRRENESFIEWEVYLVEISIKTS